MMKPILLIASVLLANSFCYSAAAGSEPEAPAAVAKSDLGEIKISLFSHRRTPNLYWRVDESGRGEVSTPEAIGYRATAPLIIGPAYSIAPGVHRFDIGEAGFIRLRSYLGQIIDGKIDRYEMTDGECALRNVTHSGSVELDWSGPANGELHLAHECLNGAGQQFKDRMVLAWHELASMLHSQGEKFVVAEQQPAKRVPATLRFTKKNIWTAATTIWQIAGDGKGWVEFSDDANLPTLDIGERNFVRAGRYPFKLDPDFHQALLRELDPYLSKTKIIGSCEDEISMTDQPMVRIEWKDKAGKPASFASDLGCPSFAMRFRNVELAFAELIRNKTLAESRLLSANGQPAK